MWSSSSGTDSQSDRIPVGMFAGVGKYRGVGDAEGYEIEGEGTSEKQMEGR